MGGKSRQNNLPRAQWCCIWCDGRPPECEFKAREHVVPESLGADRDYRLKRGVVCDACNKGVLQQIDEELNLNAIIRWLRCEFKLGPTFRQLRPGIEYAVDDDLVTVTGERLGSRDRVDLTLHSNRTANISIKTGGPSSKSRSSHFTRGLHRMAYNALAHEYGSAATRQRFAYLRELVLDLPSIATRAFLYDTEAALRAARTGESAPPSRADVVCDASGQPDTVRINIGPFVCFAAVTPDTKPLARIRASYPWLQTYSSVDW